MKIRKNEILNVRDIKILAQKSDLYKAEYIEDQDSIVVYFNDDVTLEFGNQILSGVCGIEFNNEYAEIKLVDNTSINIYSAEGFFTLDEDKEFNDDEITLLKLSYHDYPKFLCTDNIDTDNFPIYETKVHTEISPYTGELIYIGTIESYFNYNQLISNKIGCTKQNKDALSCNIELLSLLSSIRNNKDKINTLFKNVESILCMKDNSGLYVFRIMAFKEHGMLCKDANENIVDVPYNMIISNSGNWESFNKDTIYIKKDEDPLNYRLSLSSHVEKIIEEGYDKNLLLNRYIDMIHALPGSEYIELKLQKIESGYKFDNYEKYELRKISENINNSINIYKEISSENYLFSNILVEDTKSIYIINDAVIQDFYCMAMKSIDDYLKNTEGDNDEEKHE